MMTETTRASGSRSGISGKILLTVSPFVLLLALFLIQRWLS